MTRKIFRPACIGQQYVGSRRMVGLLALLGIGFGLTTAVAQPRLAITSKALASASSRDLEPFFYMRTPPTPFFPQTGDDPWAVGLPTPPVTTKRDMLTSTVLPAGFAPLNYLALMRRTPTSPARALIKPFDLVGLSKSAPQLGVPLGVERLQPGTSITVFAYTGSGSARYTFDEPLLRTTLDGSIYEAAPVTVTRNSAPYTTLYFGYRMGLIAAQTAAGVPAAEREYYELVSLPAPTVEGRVTEYIYRPVADAATPRVHVFYTANEAERAVLDNDENWMRSGYEFKSGGYLPVCRFFYKPPNGGPSTHFYTAKADECQQLKATAGFTHEGTPFRVSLPRPPAVGQSATDPARCPEKTVPMWRFFNQPTDPAVAPNHRYLMSRTLGQENLPGWVNEGIAFCVPE